MIVDCHTHISLSADEVDISEHLDAAEKVDVCVVLAPADVPTGEANGKLSDYVGRHKEKMVGFAVVDPLNDPIGPKAIKSIVEKGGHSGFVLYCSAMGFHPANSKAMRFYETAVELGMPVFFHNCGHLGSDAVLEYAQPFMIDEVARAFGELKIVIGSMGAPFVEQCLSVAGKHENVYADLTINPARAWQVYNVVTSTYEQGLMDKLLFGSGYPNGNAGECMEALLGFNKLIGDANLPVVPRGAIRNVIERDSLDVLGISAGGGK